MATLAERTREHRRLLRALGFRLVHRTRHQDGDMDVYELRALDRVVDVQLWDDGRHRASHMYDTQFSRAGMCTTRPTDFLTPLQMLAAIWHETTRMDR